MEGEPVVLPIGTGVSARYRGAFCEAKITKVAKCVRCKVSLKESGINLEVSDEDIRGPLKVGATVEVKKPATGQYHEATLLRVTDTSSYTVVFDDGDQNTLKRSKFCLKGKRHFIQTDTLDQLPLTNPEQFGTPVVKGKKDEDRSKIAAKRRIKGADDSHSSQSENEDTEVSDEVPVSKRTYAGRLGEMVGRVVSMEIEDRKKTAWLPVLVVQPSADNLDLPTRDHLLVRSFKDSKFYAVIKKDSKDFTRETALKNEDKSLKTTFEKALVYLDTRELPQGWDKEHLLGKQNKPCEQELDDEPSEEKDMFVALLYKFMDDRGTPLNKAPTIVGRDLDLFRLFRIVKDLGGYNRVTNQQKWHIVYSKMALPLTTNSANQIKTSYKKYLHAFEDFYRKLGSTMGNTPGKARNTPGRNLLPHREREREREVFPKSPVNSTIKRIAKEDEKEVKEEKKDEELLNDKVEFENQLGDSIRVTLGTARAVEIVKKEKEVPKEPVVSRTGVVKEEVNQVSKPVKKVLRGKASMIEEAEKPNKSNDTDSEKEMKKPKMKMRRRPGDVDADDEVERKKRRRGDSECTTGEETAVGKGSEKMDPDESDTQMQTCVLPHYPIGTRLKVRYKTHKDIYEAKVTKVREIDGQVEYFVHYAGWNNRYDEWVSAEYIEGPSGPEALTIKPLVGKGKTHPLMNKNFGMKKTLLATRSGLMKDSRSSLHGTSRGPLVSTSDNAKKLRLQNGKFNVVAVRLKRLSASSQVAVENTSIVADEEQAKDEEKDVPVEEVETVTPVNNVLRGRKDSVNSPMPQLTKEEPNIVLPSIKSETDMDTPDLATSCSQRLSVDTVCAEILPVLDTPLLPEPSVEPDTSQMDIKTELDCVEETLGTESREIETKKDEDEDKAVVPASAKKRSRRRKQSEMLIAPENIKAELDSMDVLAAVAASKSACENDSTADVITNVDISKKSKGGKTGNKSAKCETHNDTTECDSIEGTKLNDESTILPFSSSVPENVDIPVQHPSVTLCSSQPVACSSGEQSRDEACSTKSEHEANMEVETLLRAAALRDAGCDSPTALEAVSTMSNGSGCNNSESGDVPPEQPSKSKIKEEHQEVRHRRRRRRNSDRAKTSKQTFKQTAGTSDSDGDCDDPRSPGTMMKLASISPRPAKFNFTQCLDDLQPFTPERRIEILMAKIGEMRKMYSQLKCRVAAIDRLRKRHRREREAAEKSVVDSVSCS